MQSVVGLILCVVRGLWATHSLAGKSSTSVLWVLTGTHPCDALIQIRWWEHQSANSCVRCWCLRVGLRTWTRLLVAELWCCAVWLPYSSSNDDRSISVDLATARVRQVFKLIHLQLVREMLSTPRPQSRAARIARFTRVAHVSLVPQVSLVSHASFVALVSESQVQGIRELLRFRCTPPAMSGRTFSQWGACWSRPSNPSRCWTIPRPSHQRQWWWCRVLSRFGWARTRGSWTEEGCSTLSRSCWRRRWLSSCSRCSSWVSYAADEFWWALLLSRLLTCRTWHGRVLYRWVSQRLDHLADVPLGWLTGTLPASFAWRHTPPGRVGSRPCLWTSRCVCCARWRRDSSINWIWGTSVIIWTLWIKGFVSTVQLQSSTGSSARVRRKLHCDWWLCDSGRDDWFLAMAHDCHVHDLVEVLGLWDLSCFSTFWIVVTCLCVPTGTFTICSRVCCCTRSFNGWICSRAAARSACALLEFVQSGFSSSKSSLSLGAVRISLRPGEGGWSRTLHLSRIPGRSGWAVAGVQAQKGALLGSSLRDLDVCGGIATGTCTARRRHWLWGTSGVSCSAITGTSLSCFHGSFQNVLLRNHLDHISSLLHHNQWYTDVLRGSLGFLYHWHLSLRMSCLDGWHLVSHHNCFVYDLVGVLDLWELHGLLHFWIPSAYCVSQRACPSAAPVVSRQSSGSSEWAALSLHHGFVSMNCACGNSTILGAFWMVGTCVCVTNGSFAALSNELGSAAASGQGFRRSCRWTATAGLPSTVWAIGACRLTTTGLSQLLFKSCICWLVKKTLVTFKIIFEDTIKNIKSVCPFDSKVWKVFRSMNT